MALLFFDGFENAAVANDLTDGKWDNKAGTLTTTIVNTRFSSGRALELSGTDGVTKDITIANTETAYIGFALVVRSVTTTPQTIFTFFQATAASGPQFYIRLNSARKLEFVRGAPDTGTVLGTTTLDFPDDVWRYVEVKLRVHATLGTLEVKINGAVDITELTSQDTEHDAGTGVASLGPGGTGSGAVSYEIDDLYINDDTGSLNNDYLG
ncbi:MAG: hypothetical protein KAJ03_06995, partial [Gammaproteobacteria bacterium]|nr:hypothetical protein [Gammaproteobacteria bacterium]